MSSSIQNINSFASLLHSHLVHPLYGVAFVESVSTENIAGFSQEFVKLSFLSNKMTMRIPTQKLIDSGIRSLSSLEDMEKALEIIHDKPKYNKAMWIKRSAEYKAKINSGIPSNIAEVVRDLKRSVLGEYSLSEREVLFNALKMLSQELSVLRHTDEKTILNEIIQNIENHEGVAMTA